MTLTQKTFSPAMQRRLRQGAAEIASLDDDIDQLNRLLKSTVAPCSAIANDNREE